jgi:D-alanyl-D-alanine carboxypeptidase/D-alanyl-D-alanine-endopeptidase (penicillin-binding protein 4)
VSENPQSKAPRRPLAGIVQRARRHPRALLIAGAATALVVLGSGSLVLGAAVGASRVETQARIAVPDVSAQTSVTPTPTPTQTSRPVPAAAQPAQPVRTCSIAEAASDSRLGTFQGSVRNAATGEVLYDHGGGTFSRTASVMKVLTSAAALAVLGPDYRASTTVVAGSQPGQVIVNNNGPVVAPQKVSDGIDTLTNIEQVKFADGTLAVAAPGVPTITSATAGVSTYPCSRHSATSALLDRYQR